MMKRVIKITESDIINLVKKIVNEQERMSINNSNQYKNWPKDLVIQAQKGLLDPYQLKMLHNKYDNIDRVNKKFEKQKKLEKDTSEKLKGLKSDISKYITQTTKSGSDYFSDIAKQQLQQAEYQKTLEIAPWMETKSFFERNKHDIIAIASLGTFLLGGPVGIALALGLDLVNAALYLDEGDKYNAGFTLAFSLIPIGELVAKIPVIKKLGRDGLTVLIKKVRSNKYKELTKLEIESIKQISKNTKWIKLESLKSTIKLTINSFLKKMTLKDIVFKFYKLSKKYPKIFNLSKYTVLFGSTYYTYEQLAKMMGISENQKSTSNKNLENKKLTTVEIEEIMNIMSNMIDSEIQTTEDADSLFNSVWTGDK